MTYSVVYCVRYPSNDGSGIDDIGNCTREFADLASAQRFAAKLNRRNAFADVFHNNDDGSASIVR